MSGRLALLFATCVLSAAVPSGVHAQTLFEGRATPEDLSEPEKPNGSIFDRESVREDRSRTEAALAASPGEEREALLRERLEELDRAASLLEAREDPIPVASTAPPYSLRDLDAALERLTGLRAGHSLLDDAVGSAEHALDAAEDLLRQVRDTGAREAIETAEVRVELAKLQLRNARLERRTSLDALEGLERAVEEKRRKLIVREDDLTARIEEYDAERRRVAEEREALTPRIAAARREAEDARTAGASPVRLEALDAIVVSLERRAALLDSRIRNLMRVADAWTSRYRLGAGALDDQADEDLARGRLEAGLDELVHEQDVTEAGIERLRASSRLLDRRLDAASGEAETDALSAHRDALQERLEAEQAHLASLRPQVEAHRRWLDAFDGGVTENLETGVRAIGDRFREIWNLELAAVDERPITVGKIVLALILFVVGVFVSRALARAIRRRLLDRLSMDASLASSLQTLVLYAFMLVFFLIALRFVSIPLTALTFVGGALAIGIGFGSQNIVNNFISGLILMAERPIKVGDMIEVGGTYGRVERIGGRSTRVRSGDNTHVIVPNSTFLEREVLNWTLSDTTLRTSVDVGVAYGSPTREVGKILLHVAKDHGKILERPEPEVIFLEFGDNALQFRVYFWIRMRQLLDRLRIQSDLRFRIDQAFRDAGIVIAFPQRDVHLDASGPIDVRVIPEADRSGNEDPENPDEA